MGVRFIREPSETPNISNSADARMIRYAYGGYDGVVKGKGTELSYTIDGSSFRLNSGVINLMGYEVEIDTNGWVLDVSGVTSQRYYSVYLEVNLALQTGEIKSVYSTINYPTITMGDDLTQTTSGTARLLLYYLIVNSGIINIVSKKVSVIEYMKPYVQKLLKSRIPLLSSPISIPPKIALNNQWLDLATVSFDLTNKSIVVAESGELFCFGENGCTYSTIQDFAFLSPIAFAIKYSVEFRINNGILQCKKTRASVHITGNSPGTIDSLPVGVYIPQIWLIED